MLQLGYVVLADSGFNVEDSVAYMGATLNIPAFTRGKSQLDPADVETTHKLANVRIHVQRVIGAVRFKILSATTPLPTEYTKSKELRRASDSRHNGAEFVVLCIIRFCSNYLTVVHGVSKPH